MSDNSRQRRGFTLLEVVAALAIISLVAVSALATVAQELQVATRAKTRVRAQALAAQRYASLRLLSPPELRAIPDSAARGKFAPPNNDFTWRVVQTPLMNDLYVSDVRIDVISTDGSIYSLRTRMYAPPGVGETR